MGARFVNLGFRFTSSATSLYLGPVHGEGAGARRYAWGVGHGSVETGERIVLACPNGSCGERVVLDGRNCLWYGRGRPEVFPCGGCGEQLTLAARIVSGEGCGRC